MYAVIKTGGKQYRIKEGDSIKLELLPAEIGEQINFPEILMLAAEENIIYGAPLINDAIVTGEVITHARHDKIRIIKFRRRKHYMKKIGHRQYYTQVKITQISSNGLLSDNRLD